MEKINNRKAAKNTKLCDFYTKTPPIDLKEKKTKKEIFLLIDLMIDNYFRFGNRVFRQKIVLVLT